MKKCKGKRVSYRSTKPTVFTVVTGFMGVYGGKKEGSLSYTREHRGLGMVLRRLRQELEIWFIHSFIQPLLGKIGRASCRERV